ncbi:uncharacterized protein LOC115763090 [Drosophila novamexicana]|uniref:uncharacterized protein LOC115763090 n=1 Tax=Drosophila novamexicana TaxID=47314 RepID=UPI0011E5909C|nr:uncharacterized protein LOC115763090 [Drosophila novamexicana]
MGKMLWQWQLPVLLAAMRLVHAETATTADGSNRESESALFFTRLYKRNLQQMVELRNVSAEPCEDFYAHACGNFGQLALAPDPDDAVPPFLYNMQDRMEFFQLQHANFQTLPGKLLAQLYVECKARGEQRVLSRQPAATHWERMLQQLPFLAAHGETLSSWPFLRHQWQRRQLAEELNWIHLAAQLAAHGLPTLLHVYFAEHTIYVAPMQEQPCPSLRGFQESMSTVLAGRHPQVAHIVAHELRVLCRGMRGELPLVSSLTEPNRGAQSTTSAGQEQLQLDDNTMDYFQAFFGLLNFTEQQLATARKLPLNVERITHAWQVLRHTEPRIVYNYVLWQAQQHLAYEDCFQLAAEFERLLHAEYWQWHVLTPQLTRDVALAMYQLHTTRFQQRRRATLSRRDWYGHLLPAAVERRELQVSRLLQLHAQRNLNISELTLHYGQVRFRPDCFYGNLLELRRAQLRHAFESPYVDEEDEQQSAYFLRHFLHFVLLSLHRPMYHYYATQGLELWRQSGLLQDTDGYYTALDCLERQTLQLYDAQLAAIYRPLSSHEVADVFHFHRSFQAALRDYHFWLQGERFTFAEQFVLQHFGLDEHRVLFYAVAQQLCNRQDEIFAAQLNRGYMNLPEFQTAFKCAPESQMNPPAKCMINRCE